MELFTKIPLKKQDNQIDYNSNLLLIGSCFSENIGNKLKYFKFDTEINPFGILFNPKVIEQFISDCINKRKFTENDVFYHNERWHCFDAHSYLSTSDKDELLENLNKNINSTNNRLKSASHVIITLGTSWGYRLLESDKLVANCHKIPQIKFSKEILSVNEISTSLKHIYNLINSINKNATIIYTVSPVRHIKDGFIENQQSKSHLTSGVHQVENSFYFPSYELMMDELRDYRFYCEDMIHPNKTAINYIWERFSEIWLNASEDSIRKEIDEIQKGLAHRPFNENSENYKQFITKLNSRISVLNKKYPKIKL